MGIALETTTIAGGTGDGTPPLILDAVGAKFRGLIIDIKPMQEKEYVKQADRDRGRIPRPVWWDNRMPTPLDEAAAQARGLDPVMFDVITYQTIKAGDGVLIGGDEERTPEPGELVKLFAHGPRGRGWRDANKERGTKPLVGDITLITFVSEDADSGSKKITFEFEEPTDAQVAEAEKLHHELKDQQRTPLATSTAMTAEDVAEAFDASSEPF